MNNKRISLLEWSMRLNIMLIATMGRTMSSFCEDWKWEELYHEGFSAGEVVEAIVEEFRELGVLNVHGQLVRVN